MAHLEKGIELKSRQSISSPHHDRSPPLSKLADEAELARFGKRQQLKRRFRLVAVIGLTSTLMITWEGLVGSIEGGLYNGGSAGLVYGFIFAWMGTLLQALVQAEMGSMIPISGGFYNWVAVLAPPWCSKFLSYLTGWMTTISYQANLASVAYGASLMIQGLLTLNLPDYEFQRWHGTLLFYALIMICLFINTYLARLLPHIETFVLLVHIVGFFCVLIPLLYLGDHVSPQEVFATFNDGGGWGSNGLATCVGLSTTMYGFIGSDGAAHMAEEVEGASSVVPKSMITSVVLNGVMGLALLIAALFSLTDVKSALNSSTGYPYMALFLSCTGSQGATTAMSAIIIAAFASATLGYLATASRMTWAFARERGLPGSGILSRVERRTLLPLYSIGLSTAISLLLALINIGSDTAFNAMVSIVISAYYAAFSIAAATLLWRRHASARSGAGALRFGPFHLGRAGTPIIVASIAYSIVGIFFSFWPQTATFQPESMNWSIVMAGAMLVFAVVFWFAHSRKVYTGPIAEVVWGE